MPRQIRSRVLSAEDIKNDIMHDVQAQLEKQKEEILAAVREALRQELLAARAGSSGNEDKNAKPGQTNAAGAADGAGPAQANAGQAQSAGQPQAQARAGQGDKTGQPQDHGGSAQGPAGQGQASTKDEGAGPGGGSGLALSGINLGVFKAQVQAQLSKEMEANLTKLRQVITETQELAYKLEAVLSGDVGGFGVTPKEAAQKKNAPAGTQK